MECFTYDLVDKLSYPALVTSERATWVILLLLLGFKLQYFIYSGALFE